MNKIYLALLFFVLSFCNAQSYFVTYKLRQISRAGINFETNIKTYLRGNGETSIYIEDYKKSVDNVGRNKNTLVMPTEDNPQYFKEFNKYKITYIDNIKFTLFNVTDTISKFDWKITSETKKILQYNCQKATLRFRGRDFDVFFTKDLPFSDGPLKFFGLPGLILEVLTDNSTDFFHYVAESVVLSNEKTKSVNYFENKEVISYAEFVKIYRKKYGESLTKIVTDNGETRPLSKGHREIMIE